MTRTARYAIAGSVLALALSLSSRAAAVYQCGPDKDDCQCSKDNPYPCCDNGGNCTWWAWEQACCHWVVGLPGWGNANQWAGNAKANPNYDVLSYPVVGSIANRVSGTYGHVAWVTAVSGSNVTVTEQNCWGGWGHSSATRDKSFYDGGFIVRTDTCECQPGQTQTQSCGNCGEQKRSCGADCKWDGWSTCSGEGACVPGDSEQQACGECGIQTRTCADNCSWGELGACESDPSFSGSDCSTNKPGACAEGVEKCVNGSIECAPLAEPSSERCDGVDNDCDGVTDENACWQPGGEQDAGSPPKPNAVENQLDPKTQPDEMRGGCACTLGQRPSSSSLFALGLLALGALATRTRRRSRDVIRPSKTQD